VPDRFVSLYFASIGLQEALVVARALLSWPLIRGEHRRSELQDAVARHLEYAGAYSYTSGRGALAACLAAAGVGPGDDVLLSSFTCLAVPTAVLAVGARPTYCDIDPRSLNVTPDSVVAALTPNTRAVVVQHTLGSPADVRGVVRRVRPRGILVIEDCALAIGTTETGRALGSSGDAATFSMELSKTISSGWGGVLVVNDRGLNSRVLDQYARLDQARFLRSLRMAVQAAVCGVSYEPQLYWLGRYLVAVGFRLGLFGRSTPVEEFNGLIASGFVAKLGAPQAALGAHQWNRLERIARSCEGNGVRIREALKRLGYLPLGACSANVFSVSNRVSFLVADRPAIMEWFRVRGVELGSWFDGPLSPLPRAAAFNYQGQAFPNASFVAEHIVNVPCHSRLNVSDIEDMERLLADYAADHPEDLQVQEKLQAL